MSGENCPIVESVSKEIAGCTTTAEIRFLIQKIRFVLKRAEDREAMILQNEGG